MSKSELNEYVLRRGSRMMMWYGLEEWEIEIKKLRGTRSTARFLRDKGKFVVKESFVESSVRPVERVAGDGSPLAEDYILCKDVCPNLDSLLLQLIAHAWVPCNVGHHMSWKKKFAELVFDHCHGDEFLNPTMLLSQSPWCQRDLEFLMAHGESRWRIEKHPWEKHDPLKVYCVENLNRSVQSVRNDGGEFGMSS